MMRTMGRIVRLLACAALLPSLASAQRVGQGEGATPSAQDVAPVDLTGYWVSVVTEDWAWRMRTPPPGDYASVPLNDAGRQAADAWTESEDGSCRAFGAGALLRMPLRMHVTWDDGNTLRIETDYGQQTRLLRFGATANADTRRSLQGFSVAEWQTAEMVNRNGASTGILVEKPQWASLEVVTTHLAPAWLRRNGVPYSENAVVTEQFDRFADGEDQWLTVTTIVDDPVYLTEPFVTSSNFKREPSASGWNPLPCRMD